VLRIVAAYEATSKRRTPPPAFGPLSNCRLAIPPQIPRECHLYLAEGVISILRLQFYRIVGLLEIHTIAE
jgi:hypothetical protein